MSLKFVSMGPNDYIIIGSGNGLNHWTGKMPLPEPMTKFWHANHVLWMYRKLSNIRHTILKLKCFSSRLAVVFVQSAEARYQVENEDVVGAAPTGDAPTTSEWSTILLPTKVHLILEVWQYMLSLCHYGWIHISTLTHKPTHAIAIREA